MAVLVYGYFLGPNPDSKEWPLCIQNLFNSSKMSPVHILINGRPAGSDQGLVICVPGTHYSAEDIETTKVSVTALAPAASSVLEFEDWCRRNNLEQVSLSWLLCAVED